MDNNKIDYGSWTVPTDWSQISLKQFQDIERYYDDKDKSLTQGKCCIYSPTKQLMK